MLNPRNNNDRLNYGKLLAPPVGYVLTKAVGTTYSLDLYALLAIPVAMFYAKSMEGDYKQNRYDVLDAIRQSKDKVDLFCQRGKIQVPGKYNNLLAFMDACVEEVTPSIINSSFHPKIWVLRFEKGNEQLFRLIVLSRNLTFDRSWDVAYFAEGAPLKKNTESQKLCNYLNYFYARTKREADTNFMKNLGKVEFTCPNGFFGFEMFPILGFDNNIKDYPNPLTLAKYNEILIISPFVDVDTITLLKNNNNHISLFSREEELDKLDDSEINIKENDCFCINPIIVDGESFLDSEGTEPLSQNLHAKMYIGEKGRIMDWYIGSANSTSPAFGRNAEMLIKISTKQQQYSIAEIKKTLLDEKYKFFVKYENSHNKTTCDDSDLEKAVRKFCHYLTCIQFLGVIKPRNEGDNYDLTINADLSDLKNHGFTVEANLVHRESDKKLLIAGHDNQITFENISITNLSRYLVLKVSFKDEMMKGLLVKMDLTIPEEREDIIFNELINSKLKFLQYLQFILAPDQYTNVMEIIQEKGTEGNNENLSLQQLLGGNNGIYESLLIAASRSPRKLKEIDGIIIRLQKLNSEVVDDFLPIWEVFKEFAHA